MIGERLAEIRKDHGDRQLDLAVKLNVAKDTVSSWEQGKSEPSHDMLVRICRLYGVSADYLLGISDTDPLYAEQRRLKKLTKAENAALCQFERFLIWSRDK